MASSLMFGKPVDSAMTETTTSITTTTTTIEQKPSTPRAMSKSTRTSVNRSLSMNQPQPSSAAAQAYYRKQLKYGIYDKPGQPIVGVPKRSSDTAALLAAKSDLSLKLWQPQESFTAGTAAILANIQHKSPELWKKEHLSADAATAALYAKEKTSPVRDVTPCLNAESASRAALSVHGTSGHDFAASALPDAYEWDERRRYNIEVGRRASTCAARESLEGQQLRRSSSTASDYQNQLQNLGAIEQQARDRAKAKLSKIYLASHSGGGTLDMPAAGSHAAMKLAEQHQLTDPLLAYTPNYFDKQKHDFLLDQAKIRASQEIQRIDKLVGEWDLHRNPEFNAAALAVAEKLSKKRMEHHGKINVGGGLYMTQSEVEQIAQKNVQPALDKINKEVEAQLAADEERRQQEEEERRQRAEEKRIRNEQKAEDKRIRDEENAAKKAERARAKAEEKEKRTQQKAIEKDQKAERNAKLRNQKEQLKAQLQADKIQLKARLAAAKQADEMAKAEVLRTNALKEKAQAELEAAQIAEKQAQDEADREALAKEVAEKEAAFAEASLAADKAKQNEIRSDSMVTSTMAALNAAADAEGLNEEDAEERQAQVERGSSDLSSQAAKSSVNTESGLPDETDWQIVQPGPSTGNGVVVGNETKKSQESAENKYAEAVSPIKSPVLPSISAAKPKNFFSNIKSGFRKGRRSVSGGEPREEDKASSSGASRPTAAESALAVGAASGAAAEAVEHEPQVVSMSKKDEKVAKDSTASVQAIEGGYIQTDTSADGGKVGGATANELAEPKETSGPAIANGQSKDLKDGVTEKAENIKERVVENVDILKDEVTNGQSDDPIAAEMALSAGTASGAASKAIQHEPHVLSPSEKDRRLSPGATSSGQVIALEQIKKEAAHKYDSETNVDPEIGRTAAELTLASGGATGAAAEAVKNEPNAMSLSDKGRRDTRDSTSSAEAFTKGYLNKDKKESLKDRLAGKVDSLREKVAEKVDTLKDKVLSDKSEGPTADLALAAGAASGAASEAVKHEPNLLPLSEEEKHQSRGSIGSAEAFMKGDKKYSLKDRIANNSSERAAAAPVPTKSDSSAASSNLASSAARSMLDKGKTKEEAGTSVLSTSKDLASTAARAAVGNNSAEDKKTAPVNGKIEKSEYVDAPSQKKHDNERTFSGFSSHAVEAHQEGIDSEMGGDQEEHKKLQEAIDTVRHLVNRGGEENQPEGIFKEEIN